MSLQEQKLLAKPAIQFYEESGEKIFESGFDPDSKHHATVFEIISSVRIREFGPSFSVEITKAREDVPNTISEAFARHLWYSQWNYADVVLIEIPISDQHFFFLFHLGVVDDGYDNGITFIEVFAEQGDFICATDLVYDEANSRKWSMKQFAHEDFELYGTRCPRWPGNYADETYSGEPLWTENSLIEKGAEIERNGPTTRITVRAS